MPKRKSPAWTQQRSKRKRLMKRLWARHDGICAHCGKQCVPHTSEIQIPDGATIDHCPPRCELPVEQWFNDEHCVLSCTECNWKRGREMYLRKREASNA